MKTEFISAMLAAMIAGNTYLTANAQDFIIPSGGTFDQAFAAAQQAHSPSRDPFYILYNSGPAQTVTNALSVTDSAINLETRPSTQASQTVNFSGDGSFSFLGSPQYTSVIGGILFTGAENTAVNSSQTLSIINSIFDTNSSTQNGGAVNFLDYGFGTVSGTDFKNNTAAQNGGAINATGNNSISILSGNFENNKTTSGSGGAVYLGGSGTDYQDSGASYTNNSAAQNGGAIANDGNNSIIFFGNTFTENKAGGNGGALYNASNGNIFIGSGDTQTSFTDNSATGEGGAIYNAGTLTLNSQGNDINFSGNTSTQGSNDIHNDGGTININGSRNSVNITGGISGTGIINKTNNGTLNLDGTNSNYTGTFNANGGTTVVNSDFFTGTNNINTNGTLQINSSGNATLKTGDSWTGTINNSGEFTLDNFNKGSDGVFNQSSGTTNLQNSSNISLSNSNINGGIINVGNGQSGVSTLNVTNGTVLQQAVTVNLDANNNLNNSGGVINLNDNDTLNGNINISGGTSNFENATTSSAVVNATNGNININSGSLSLGTGSVISAQVNTNITDGSSLDIAGGDVTLNQGDNWNGGINLSDGNLVVDNFTKSDNSTFNQTGGTMTLQNNSNFHVNSNSLFSNANIAINSGSTMFLNQSSNISGINNLFVNNGNINAIDNNITTYNTGGNFLPGAGGANFYVDINEANETSDLFKFNHIDPGRINLSHFNPINPTKLMSDFQVRVFQAVDNNYNGVNFTAPDEPINTVIGRYNLSSLGQGYYGIKLLGYNPQVFRGQVATMAMYNSQLTVMNSLFDHVYIDSESMTAMRNSDYRYAAANPLFAPYQFKREEGSLWFKTYTSIEKLSLTQNLHPNNTIYGQIVGADFPTVHLENGWEFLPTAYIAYNGGRQSFDDVTLYQNGGQGGFMGTWMKHEFIGSVLAYGGGYGNEMSLNGTTDKTGNWFAGVATKSAYNFHPRRNIIIQPNLVVAYNIFGKQNWNSDFGAVSMNAGYLNGINVAPGLNVIYGGEDWSIYGTIQYMFYINDKLNGRIADTELPNVRMKHGVIEYGVGATKTWKDRYMGYFQFVIRNGGRTGVGFQLGMQIKF